METENFTKYKKNLWGIALIGLGAFFLIEHIWTWGEIDFFDFIGHEWLGFLLIIVGALLNVNWSKARLSIEIKNLWEKIKW